MAESTIRKTKVSFTINASGTFVVEHPFDESPSGTLKDLVDDKQLSLPDLYLHSEEFEWSIETTDDEDEFVLRRHLEWAHGQTPDAWEHSESAILRAAHREAHGDIHDLSTDERGQGAHVHSCSPDDPSDIYPPEIGGGVMSPESKTLICACGRRFPSEEDGWSPTVMCVCGRTAEQFERDA